MEKNKFRDGTTAQDWAHRKARQRCLRRLSHIHNILIPVGVGIAVAALSIFIGLTILFSEAQAASSNQAKQPAEQARLQEVCAQHKGYPYVWGGESPKEGGYDCSGFVYSVAKKLGCPLPRTTSRKYWILFSNSEVKSWTEALWGSLIWFTFSDNRPYGHIGIITELGKLWQSGSSTGPVEVGIWKGSYWDSISVGVKAWLSVARPG